MLAESKQAPVEWIYQWFSSRGLHESARGAMMPVLPLWGETAPYNSGSYTHVKVKLGRAAGAGACMPAQCNAGRCASLLQSLISLVPACLLKTKAHGTVVSYGGCGSNCATAPLDLLSPLSQALCPLSHPLLFLPPQYFPGAAGVAQHLAPAT